MNFPTPALLLLALALPAAAQSGSPDEQYRYLVGLADKGLHELAASEAQSFLRAHPQHEKALLARYRLANALWELGQSEPAASEYERCARETDFEYRAEALFRVGEAARARGDRARARTAFEGVLAAGQDYLVPAARLALGEEALAAREPDVAEEHLGALLTATPRAPEAEAARRSLVWCAFQRGDLAATRERAQRFLRESQDPALLDEVRLLLGEATLESDPRAALAAFRSVKSPTFEDARLRGEGFALAASDDHAGAARAFETLVERFPASRHAPEAALHAGIARLRAGDTRGALERLGALAKNGDGETLYWLAQAQKGAGDARAALATLERAQRTRPARELATRLEVLRGDCLVADGRPGEALAAFERSGSTEALYAGAVAALNQGDSAAALRAAERLLAADPSGPRAQAARIVRVEALFAAQRYAEAEEAAGEALRTPTDAAEAARLGARRGWCRYLAGDLEGACARFEEAARGAGVEGEEALGMLVRIRGDQGRAADAAVLAARYLERFPEGPGRDAAWLARARGTEGEAGLAAYRELLKRVPEGEVARRARLEAAERLTALGRGSEAARLQQELVARAPESSEAARARYALAWNAWEAREHAACEELLAPLVADARAEPTLRAAALELALSAQLALGRLDEGLASWRALAELGADEPRTFESARRLLAALREKGDERRAGALLDECARRFPARRGALELEGLYLALERQDLAGAAAALERARKNGGDPAPILEAAFHLGDAELAAGDARAAEAHLLDATRAPHARRADALYKLAFAQLARGEVDGARRALAKFQAEHADSPLAPEAGFLAGECAYRGGDLAAAATAFAAVLPGARGELRARILFRAGLTAGALERWNECEAALSELARDHADFPNLAEGELWRGRALLAQKKLRPARAAFERTLALDQGELAAGARLGLGRIAAAEGKHDAALSEYLKVALLFAHEPSVAEALYRAGEALEALGDPAKAAARYREVLAEHARSTFAAAARERLAVLETR